MTPDIKERVTDVVREEFLTESIWLRRLVLRELQAISSADSAPQRCGSESTVVRGQCSRRREPISSLYIRLRKEDRLLLHERAAARGMASATYASVLGWRQQLLLTYANVRASPPIPICKPLVICSNQIAGTIPVSSHARRPSEPDRLSGDRARTSSNFRPAKQATRHEYRTSTAP